MVACQMVVWSESNKGIKGFILALVLASSSSCPDTQKPHFMTFVVVGRTPRRTASPLSCMIFVLPLPRSSSSLTPHFSLPLLNLISEQWPWRIVICILSVAI